MVKPKWIFHLCRRYFYRGLHMTLLECRDTKLWPVFGPCVDENLSLLWRSAGGRANYKCKDTNEKDQRTSFNSMSIPSIAGPSRKSTLWVTPAFTMNGAPISYASLSMSSAITCTCPDHESWVADHPCMSSPDNTHDWRDPHHCQSYKPFEIYSIIYTRNLFDIPFREKSGEPLTN